MDRSRRKLTSDFPDVNTYFHAGGLVDSVVNQGNPAPALNQVGVNNFRSLTASLSALPLVFEVCRLSAMC